MRLVVLGNPENRRIRLFIRACRGLGMPDPIVLAWSDYLKDERALLDVVDSCDVLRIESPGENAEVNSQLVARGGDLPFSTSEFDKGRIGQQRSWFDGFSSVLKRLKELVGGKIQFVNDPDEIVLMFDKLASQEWLQSRQIPIPKILGTSAGSNEVFELMHRHRVRRVFVKPRHSSSASGVVALQRLGSRVLATTSARIEGKNLYNSLVVNRYHDFEKVRYLLDELSLENLFVERWFPKLSVYGRIVDFRILVIAGRVRHVVARGSQSPMTNLHLGNTRCDLDLIKENLGETLWEDVIQVCEMVAASFSGCLYIAVDLMVSSSRESIAVAEVNAFGDLLPNLLSEGEDPYRAEMRELIK